MRGLKAGFKDQVSLKKKKLGNSVDISKAREDFLVSCNSKLETPVPQLVFNWEEMIGIEYR